MAEEPVSSSDLATGKKNPDDRWRKKNRKSWEQLTKAIGHLDSSEKLSFVHDKYMEVCNELHQLKLDYQSLGKEFAIVKKERDHAQAEVTKVILSRARLESLCRELQKQNKQIKEENSLRLKEEGERRKEVTSKFANKLGSICSMMDENKEKGEKIQEENVKMTSKLAELSNQFQEREQEINQMSRQLALERQYFSANIDKMVLELASEREINQKEKDVLKAELERSNANCQMLLEQNKGLQKNLDVYKNQYDDIESSLTKSTKVFDNLKVEINSMSKKKNKLEQEILSWKTKFQSSMQTILELNDMKRSQDLQIQTYDRRFEQLQKLCRQLQADRSHYLKMLKANGIDMDDKKREEVPEGEVFKMPEPPTHKEMELQTLKEKLESAQDELQRMLTIVDSDEKEATESPKLDESKPAEEKSVQNESPNEL